MHEGLRERKKQRTREAIVDAALRLFDENGFERTTVADIAAEADIAPRTFFGYFPSKEDVLFHDFEGILESLRARLRDREPGETAIDALRAWMAGLLAEADWEDERELCRRRIIRATPALEDHDRALMGRFERVLAEAVAEDLGEEPDSLRARMVGASVVAALTALRAFYKDEGDESPAFHATGHDPMAVFDEALTFLRGGVAALQEHPPPAS